MYGTVFLGTWSDGVGSGWGRGGEEEREGKMNERSREGAMFAMLPMYTYNGVSS